MMKKNYLTVSELSKIVNLPVRTLHYYDQIDLFKPAYVDPKTNYRYYSDSQIYQLDLIKSLKYIGTPLESIKYAQSLTLTELLDFLSEQEQIVEQKVQRMLEVQQTLLKTKEMIAEQINIPTYNEVYETTIPSQRLIALKTENLNIENIPNEYISSLTKMVEREGTIISRKYGAIYEMKDYQTIDEIYYDYLFTPLLTERYVELIHDDEQILIMSEGKYANIAFKYENDEQYFQAYKKLFDVVKEPLSPVYDVFMPMNYSSTEPTQFIVELKVKIS
ncbi:MerR family transcriptional regulator [Lysinibacillus endophyticus]|uniref:MerR family transcriptional regulator n=1 Tax=Ureibacillus endophyticus TaxID=1978490 RepID=UPI00209E1FD9|nr:MerR family transcriptional regulator [Lysinibacillus endophyticus]MCP1144853.1 MerR family transcriptional regulator [Lysinibacillus endophyticus]